eukprot:m.103631 g.103631  ORF g.103631 m.103631 type:complete len:792 (-) comp13245_c0_seq2:126-2501(-)
MMAQLWMILSILLALIQVVLAVGDAGRASLDQNTTSTTELGDSHHIHVWGVRLQGYSLQQASVVASELGVECMGTLGTLAHYFQFAQQECNATQRTEMEVDVGGEKPRCVYVKTHVSDTSHATLTERLRKHNAISHVLPQKEVVRVRRWEAPSDPLFSKQWYFRQITFPSINVSPVWQRGITGSGVTVAIVDDGLEKDHPELADNFDPDASHDFNDNDRDPTPRYTPDNLNKHGTRCAGVVAGGFDNAECGVGVAYDANIGGIRMLDGPVMDTVEAASLSHGMDIIDIYSNSWGPSDDGKTFEEPGPLTQRSLVQGAYGGRQGLGSIYIWASGNGGDADDCNADGYANSIYTLAVSSVDSTGQVPYYSEPCAAKITTTFSNGAGNLEVVASDLRGQCTTSFTGTSASAPIVAGIVALAMEVNPCLTWRDVQHLAILSSSPAHLTTQWVTNKAGLRYSYDFGFGLLDADDFVARAANFTSVAQQASLSSGVLAVGTVISNDVPQLFEFTVASDLDYATIGKLEHVQVNVSFKTDLRGDLEFELISPAGTRSKLLRQRPQDATASTLTWTFMSVMFWGEPSEGTWGLEVSGQTPVVDHQLVSWELILHGTLLTQQLAAGEFAAAERVTMHNGHKCTVCKSGTFWDGISRCRLCPENCTEECFGAVSGACTSSKLERLGNDRQRLKRIVSVFFATVASLGIIGVVAYKGWKVLSKVENTHYLPQPQRDLVVSLHDRAGSNAPSRNTSARNDTDMAYMDLHYLPNQQGEPSILESTTTPRRWESPQTPSFVDSYA